MVGWVLGKVQVPLDFSVFSIAVINKNKVVPNNGFSLKNFEFLWYFR